MEVEGRGGGWRGKGVGWSGEGEGMGAEEEKGVGERANDEPG